jgi:hypothetical protein
MARGCARRRWTGKPLQIAVDGVMATTEATQRVGYLSASLRLIENVQLIRDEPKERNNDHQTVKHHVIDCFDVLSIMHDVPVNLMFFGSIEFNIVINLSPKRMHGHERNYERN